jgi:hypothetical protein
MSTSWYVGDLWTVTAAITNPKTGAKVEPDTVVVTFTDPTGATSTPAVTKDAVGEDHATVELTKPGTWHATVSTTGEYKGVETISISVKKAPTP